MAYSFRAMTVADLTMVGEWLQTPAVRQWWVDADGTPADPIDREDLDDPHIDQWIVGHAGVPFAFLQDYDPHAWPGHHFGDLPPGARGIDQFIGVPAMIERGHGSGFIRAYADRLIAQGVPAIGTDPSPDNHRAIAAYRKAGFAPGEARQTQWGCCLLMTRRT